MSPGPTNLKAGMQWGWGTAGTRYDMNGDLEQYYSNGTPTSVGVYLTPFEIEPRLDADLGLYVQDQWTLNRFTINAGIRYEYLEQSLRETEKPAGRFSPAVTWPAVNCETVAGMTCWSSWSPRLGLAYDLSGDGKTALNVSYGKYMTPNATSFAALFHPVQQFNPGFQSRTWTDRNGDDIAQDSEIGPNPNPDYGIRVVRNLDPDFSREFNRQLSAGIQHELGPGVAATFNYYRRTLHSSQYTDNVNRNGLYEGQGADWASFATVNPVTGEPLTIFRLDQASFGTTVNNVVTNYESSENRRNVYTGFELGVSARLPRRINAYAAWTFDRTVNVACDSTDDPNTLRFCDGSGEPRLSGEPSSEAPFRTELKFGGNLPVWYGFEVSAALQSYAGLTKNVTWTVTPGVTRFPSDCQFAGCTPGAIVMSSRYAGDPGIANIQLVPPGTRFLPRSTQLDFGLKRNFPIGGGRRIQAEFNVFNMLNDNAVLQEVQALGSNAVSAPFLEDGPGGRPTGIMYPRIMRIGASMRF
jgi:hypothetical protein